MKKNHSNKLLCVKAILLLVLYLSSMFKVEATSWHSLFKVAPNDGVSFEIDGKNFYAEADKTYRFYGKHTVSMVYPLLTGGFKKEPLEKQTEIKIKTVLTKHKKPLSASLFFLATSERRKYHFHDGTIVLDLTKTVFPPSEQGAKHFLEVIKTFPGETVIDVGTGSGVLGIAAAKMGSEVYATDIHHDAVAIARHNAQLNKINMQVEQGSYFDPFNRKFDVVIANLPQEIIPQAYASKIGNHLNETIAGGKNGNHIMLGFLKILPQYMEKNSRAYVCAYGISDYLETIEFCTKNYTITLQKVITVPVKDYVLDNIEYFKQLSESGKIVLFQEDKQWKTVLYFLELKLIT